MSAHDGKGGSQQSSVVAEDSPIDSSDGWTVVEGRRPEGLLRRLLTTNRHILGTICGALVAHVDAVRKEGDRGAAFAIQRVVAFVVRPFLSRELRRLPFPQQFRRRLEALGPTYIKLGQVLALREDLLPQPITEELKRLLDRLPVMPFERYLERIEKSLQRPVAAMFSRVDPTPLGSASIAQIHRATTIDGEEVILKVVKPGIATTLRRDAVLLKLFGALLQLVLARYQPSRVIREFCDYTLKEVDLRREADNAETFAANFRDMDGVVFPKIYRQFSAERVLCMEFFDGFSPSAPQARSLSEEDRDRLIDQGAAAIIRMLYKDGFFHADLHPGNLMILPGPRCGFIDLAMVGRFDDELRRTLLYYYYCLVMKDAENAARYLAAIAQAGPGSDRAGFRREVEEICRRWSRSASFEEFSLAQLILESVGKAGHYRIYFPVEMVLMVKALVTFEAVGHLLKPHFNVAEVSQRHINRIFFGQFNPLRLAKESLRGAPEVVDALVKAPLLVTEGLKYLEEMTKRQHENPFTGLRGALIGGFSLIAGAILIAAGGPWYLWLALLAIAFYMFARQRR